MIQWVADPMTDPWDERYIYLHGWLIFMVNVGKYTWGYILIVFGFLQGCEHYGIYTCSGVIENQWVNPGIPTTIKTMGVNITTIVYLRVLIIQIGEKPLF